VTGITQEWTNISTTGNFHVLTQRDDFAPASLVRVLANHVNKKNQRHHTRDEIKEATKAATAGG
jgi:hypothetical protein